MKTVLEIAFWLCLLLFVYPYAVYPPLIRLLARHFPQRRQPVPPLREWPAVTFIVSAYNEDGVIARKLDNTLAIDYPAERFEVIVISDASSDGTDRIVTERAAVDPRIRLLRQEQRLGKSAGLNHGVARARGDIVVFSDANAMYRPDAVRELVAEFADPDVGYVVGAALYNAGQEGEAAASEGAYWGQELRLKAAESRFCSVVGGDGAIYAIRRRLFRDLRDDDISDFVNPLQIISAGYRGVFRPGAICYEDAGDAFDKEFRRKRRIVNRTWRAVRRYAGGLNWRQHGRFVFALLSHKVIRWFGLATLALAVTLNVAILAVAPATLYALTLAGLVGSAILALEGARRSGSGHSVPRLLYLAYYFYLVNAAALLGIWDELRGVRHATWEHIRHGTAGREASGGR